MKSPRHIHSTLSKSWSDVPTPATSAADAYVEASGVPAETWAGFGACFNELGWQALRGLPAPARGEVLDALFGPDGLRLDLGRIPMGASDYAAEWHSYTERRDDFALDGFSIARDQAELLPYIHEALARRPDLHFFGSPWSPPTWMKSPAVYNYGRFRMEPRYLEAYARYFGHLAQATPSLAA